MQFLLNHFIRIREKNVLHTPRIPGFLLLRRMEEQRKPPNLRKEVWGFQRVEKLVFDTLADVEKVR